MHENPGKTKSPFNAQKIKRQIKAHKMNRNLLKINTKISSCRINGGSKISELAQLIA